MLARRALLGQSRLLRRPFHGTPSAAATADAAAADWGDEHTLRSLCCEHVPMWGHAGVAPEDLEVTQLLGGLTNLLYTVRAPLRHSARLSPPVVLVRRYGLGSDAFINRDIDCASMVAAGNASLGPACGGHMAARQGGGPKPPFPPFSGAALSARGTRREAGRVLYPTVTGHSCWLDSTRAASSSG